MATGLPPGTELPEPGDDKPAKDKAAPKKADTKKK
jgi:hypothetical protein